VTHYAVPNMTANLARSASRALANAFLPFVTALAGHGTEEALRRDPGLAQGAYLLRGRLVHARAGMALGWPVTPLETVLGEGGRS
jgi:alanine dehydrogenase